MSYRIDYEPHKNKLYPTRKLKKKRTGLITGCVLCTIFFLGLFARNQPMVEEVCSDSIERLCVWLQDETQIGRKTTEYAQILFSYGE